MIKILSLITALLMPSLFALDLSFLESNEREVVPKLAFDKSVWFFYKPDCPVCYRQVQNLECLKNSDIKIVTAGFNGERLKLWRESKRLKISKVKPYRSYIVDSEAIRKLPLKKDLSPQITLFKKQKLVKHFIGLTKCHDILKVLK
jgi:hypothetical protein